METGTYRVHYATTRAEVWHWYWRAWTRPRGLWRFHVLIAGLCAVFVSMQSTEGPFSIGQFFAVMVTAFLACVAVLPLWPQLQFKRETRTLIMTTDGLETTIGKRSGSRKWTEIASVEKADSGVVITGKNRNAFIVPARAFDSAADGEAFYRAAAGFLAERGS